MELHPDADLSNADWTKRSWDLPIHDAEGLQRWLAAKGVTLAHFKTLPVYRFNVDKPEFKWLKDMR